jgi:hypothetical protein
MGVVIAVPKTTPFAAGSGTCHPEFPDGFIYLTALSGQRSSYVLTATDRDLVVNRLDQFRREDVQEVMGFRAIVAGMDTVDWPAGCDEAVHLFGECLP